MREDTVEKINVIILGMEEGEDFKKMSLSMKELESLNRIGKQIQGRVSPLLVKPKDK